MTCIRELFSVVLSWHSLSNCDDDGSEKVIKIKIIIIIIIIIVLYICTSKKKQRIKKKYKITTNQELQAARESLKMRIQAKAQRIRRYVKRSKQFSQNQMFPNNRKKFFRSLGKEQISVEKPPKEEATETFWRSVLENNREYNHLAEWIKREEQKYTDVEYQPWEDISLDEFQTALRKTSSWKSPGPDAVPNFWLKQLTALHHHLLNAYNQVIEQSENLPDWFTTAQTYLPPKNKDTENPQNYRPIACLSTSYKVLTSILTERSYTHITKNDIIPEEQRGCARNSYGCKDQLLINKVIIEDCKKKKKNLSMAWIDYRKAYDSVPHGWILKTLQMYRFNEKLIKFMEASMSNWKTTMKLFYNAGCITMDQIKIKRGIFQGDSFLPLLFCLALVPLINIRTG